jgi:antitoxin YefM
MLSAIRLETRVLEGGRVEITSSELQEGSEVEVIVMVRPKEADATEHLLSSEANRGHLEQALEDLKDPDKRVTMDIADLEP